MKLKDNEKKFVEDVRNANTQEKLEEVVDDFTFEHYKTTDLKPEYLVLPKEKFDGMKMIQTCLGYIKVKLV